ncbi:multidrug/Oligosaccharidyl-lipid/Polysaccharide flippase [Rhizoctonia solani AG-1 IA]|uniref:Multidrug/Oligosaccharidyl-lipid/Polysaccharide flippase n=1 Tax=Thanatephorus cucumeris (strain AG1-IA) TaxID=983506 RepID=L8X6R8_THACA|nr:multidrug/Oligosaccharidyl-lipid/Polysaccharide flippase [Rhizoctonia solani AG-1 IA]
MWSLVHVAETPPGCGCLSKKEGLQIAVITRDFAGFVLSLTPTTPGVDPRQEEPSRPRRQVESFQADADKNTAHHVCFVSSESQIQLYSSVKSEIIETPRASTVPHFSSGSLPSDYGLLNHFHHSPAAISRPEIGPDGSVLEDDGAEGTSPTNRYLHVPGTSPTRRRMSYGSIPVGANRRGSHGNTRRPSISMPANPPEAEPLLGGTSVPRIDEEGDDKEEDEAEPSWTERLQESKYSLVIASVISIGHLSTEGLAASTLGSMTASVTGLSIVQGFASALDSLLPQAWTSDNPRNVGLWTHAESILLVLRQEPEIARLAGIYLKWLSIGLPAYSFNVVIRNFLRFVGAPLATAISFNLIAVCSVVYGLLYTPGTAWHPIGRRSFRSLGTLVQLGLAGTGQIASEWWSWELVGLAANKLFLRLGPVALAAQSVLLVSSSTSYQAPFALGVATTVRIGNLLGSGHGKKARIAAEVSLVLSLIFALCLSLSSSFFFLVFRKRWGYLFNNDETVIRLVGDIMPLVALFQIVDGMNAVTGGALRARGKQSLGALVNVTAYYVVGIPLGIYLAFWWNMELRGLWIGLATALFYSAVVSAYVILRTNWSKEVLRVRARLEEDGKLPHESEHIA